MVAGEGLALHKWPFAQAMGQPRYVVQNSLGIAGTGGGRLSLDATNKCKTTTMIATCPQIRRRHAFSVFASP